MKIIHHPETCPLCEYSRKGLEPGRPCPECGVGLFPGAPVLDFSNASRRWIRLLISVVLFGQAFLYVFVRFPGWKVLAPLFLVAAVGHICTAWGLATIRRRAMFSIGEIVFVQRGRVLWRLSYDDSAIGRARWPLVGVVLRDQDVKRRLLPAWRRKDQKTIIAAIDDVLARYRTENELLSPTRAAGFSLRDRAATPVPPQREE